MIRNVTLIVGLTDHSAYIEKDGLAIRSENRLGIITLFNFLYLLKYVSNYRFVYADTIDQKFSQREYDITSGVITHGNALANFGDPNISLPSVISQFRCVPFHSARRPSLKNIKISNSLKIITIQGFLTILVSTFGIILAFSVFPRKYFKFKLQYLLSNTINIFFGITFFEAKKIKNSSFISVGSAAAIFFLTYILVFFSTHFTTDKMSFEKDRELKTPEELVNWNLKWYVSVNDPCQLGVDYKELTKLLISRKQIAYGHPLEAIVTHEPGMIVSTINTNAWYTIELVYYRGYKKYAEKNYLFRGQFYPNKICFKTYNKRATKEKLKLLKLWMRGLHEMDLMQAAMHRPYLVQYNFMPIPPDQFKNIIQFTGAQPINMTFVQPIFNFTLISLSFIIFIFCLEHLCIKLKRSRSELN